MEIGIVVANYRKQEVNQFAMNAGMDANLPALKIKSQDHFTKTSEYFHHIDSYLSRHETTVMGVL